MLAVIGLAFVTCEIKYVGVALLTVGLAFTGCAYGAGFLVNYNDISGKNSFTLLLNPAINSSYK